VRRNCVRLEQEMYSDRIAASVSAISPVLNPLERGDTPMKVPTPRCYRAQEKTPRPVNLRR
jgi:hypothetical protein